jgi:hypothetical protein
LQVVGLVQLPQLPLQPSGPHCFPLHCGTQAHWPLALQVAGLAQLPQLPLQLSGPHCFPLHCGTHVH